MAFGRCRVVHSDQARKLRVPVATEALQAYGWPNNLIPAMLYVMVYWWYIVGILHGIPGILLRD